jgi:hypothetical protein
MPSVLRKIFRCDRQNKELESKLGGTLAGYDKSYGKNDAVSFIRK